MKNTYKLISALFIFLFFITSSVKGQHWLGYANSSYSGTNGMYLNPATMANNKYNFYMNLAGVNVNFHNDYMKLDMPYSPWRAVFGNVPNEYLDDSGNPKFENSYLKENLNGNNKDVSLMAEVRGPSFLFSIGPKHTVAFGTRVRVATQVLDLNENLARIIRWGTDPSDPAFSGPDSLAYNTLYGQNDFTLNTNAFAEYSLSYAGLVYEDEANALKVGFTLKRLTGLYSAYFQNKPGGGVIVYDNDSIGFVNTSLQYAYVNENYYTDNNADLSLSRILFQDPLGKGWGFDIGFAYEFRPDYENFKYTMDGRKRYDRSSVKHKLRLAASVVDIGGINYNNSKWVGERVLAQNLSRDIGQIDTMKRMFDNFGSDATNQEGFVRFNDYFSRISGGFAEESNSFRALLPTTLNLQVDYNIQGNFFINATYVQSLRKRGTVGMRHFSQLSATPRYESQWFEAAVPFVINNDFKSANFGIFLKLGPLFIGSDRVGSLLFNSKSLFGMDVYAGLAIPLAYKRPRDRDLDMVSNKKDICPDEAGVWKLKGCPDTDNDGVADKDDNCPDIAGRRATKGCPDTDKDGVADSVDVCPKLKGIRKYKGCPDTDKDGIPDNEDKCPETVGPKEFKGCPDSDGDGIPDYIDVCPNKKGPKQYNGCPEQPIIDDGAETDEPAPTVEETPAPQEDVLPDTQDEGKVLQEVYDNLEFETGSSVIKKESYRTLDNLVALLKAKKTYLLSLEGHTDNVGDASTNMAISKARARAVSKYLIDKGIAKDRVFTEGFGETKPVASNATAAGRKKNRRVEFLVMRLAE